VEPGLRGVEGPGDAGLSDLRRFADLVLRWNPTVNLIARSTEPVLWERHIEDSARLWPLVAKAPALWADLGSGGGFPGVVLAILAKARGEATRFILVESDRRKAAFLQQASHTLALPVEVYVERAERLPPIQAGIVSARALSALDALLPLAQRHLGDGGIALFPKGESWETEVAKAQASWRFDLEAVVDPGHKGAVLKVSSIARA
jgi:16S rRNA (guanine527-N7)-methyltransferase